MRKFMFLSVLFLLAGFLMPGCKGEKSEKESADISAGRKIEDKVKDLSLTEKEVIAFIDAYPVFAEITRQKGEEIKPLTEKGTPLRGTRIAGELIEYKEEIDAALKKYDFTFETFSASLSKVMGAYAYGQMSGVSVEMKKLLDNPNIPEEQKEQIRKSIKEAESSEEIQASKKNWEIVQKYKSEIERLFQE